ncbi:MAG: radical SAM mobile pair protein B [Methanobrevibacter sp.]|nr:radical SAM mobile pair protein B [Methanobrevibacter sp.]
MIINHREVKSVISKSNLPIAGFTVNPYIGCAHACKYCYADFMKRFTNHKEKWGTFVDVKYWPNIKNPQKYSGKTIIVGSVTDGYHPCEKEFKKTREFLKELEGVDANLIITTKSSLILRDLDLIKKFPDPIISLSINTLDEEFRKDMDNASPISERLNTLKRFHDEGIKTVCFVSPIFPGITDVFEIINEVSDYVDYIWLENLNLRGAYKKVILDYIREKHPDLELLYEDIYKHKNMDYWSELDKKIENFANKNGYMYVIDEEPFLINPLDKPIIINYFYHEKIRQSSKNKK